MIVIWLVATLAFGCEPSKPADMNTVVYVGKCWQGTDSETNMICTDRNGGIYGFKQKEQWMNKFIIDDGE